VIDGAGRKGIARSRGEGKDQVPPAGAFCLESGSHRRGRATPPANVTPKYCLSLILFSCERLSTYLGGKHGAT